MDISKSILSSGSLVFMCHPYFASSRPYNDVWALLMYFAMAVLAADMAIHFNLAYQDPTSKAIVTSGKEILLRYLRCVNSNGRMWRIWGRGAVIPRHAKLSASIYALDTSLDLCVCMWWWW